MDTSTKLKEIEELSTSLTGLEENDEPVKAYGGRKKSLKLENKEVDPEVAKRALERQQVIRQLCDLDERMWASVIGTIDALEKQKEKKIESQLKKGKAVTATMFGAPIQKCLRSIDTLLQEYVGNTAGGVNGVVNMAKLEKVLEEGISVNDLEAARATRSSSIYNLLGDSLKELSASKKKKLASLAPQIIANEVPSWHAPSSSSSTITSLHSASTSTTNHQFLEYEQPFSPWDSDQTTMPDLDTALMITPLRKSWPHKFALVAIDSMAKEDDIKRAILEACDSFPINITAVEIFTDVVNNRQRRHAFIEVETASQLAFILNDRIRAFGVHINGQRSSIIDVEEKNILSLVTRPPMDANRLESLLKDLGVMNLVIRDTNSANEPIIYATHLQSLRSSNSSIGNRFSIFAPRDGNGDLIGKAWITFPSHSSAYSAYHSLCQCRPGAIRAFWSQKTPNHFEEAIRVRDVLAAENAELKRQLASSHPEEEDDQSPTPVDELSLNHVITNHITKVLQSVHGNIPQASQMLGMKEKTLQQQIKKLRENGVDIPRGPETRGKSRLTSTRE